jgi:hypothetical protein
MTIYRVWAQQSILYEQYIRAESVAEAEAIALDAAEWKSWDDKNEFTIIYVEGILK